VIISGGALSATHAPVFYLTPDVNRIPKCGSQALIDREAPPADEESESGTEAGND
jgi:hypothetical protein